MSELLTRAGDAEDVAGRPAMSELLTRAGALFVAPATAPARPVEARSPADIVAVLAPEDVLLAVAGGVAATLRHAHRARTVLLLVPAPLATRRPALPPAQALARRLAERDVPAAAAGATVRVGLPADGVDEAWRAITAASGAPTVIALHERADAYDALLAGADQLLLAPPPDAALTDLALASLATLGPPATLVAAPRGAVARRLAALGLARVPLAPTEVPA